MSKKANINLAYAFFILLLVGCTKELPFPDSTDNPLLVVNSLFAPHEDLLVHLSESCHIKETNCVGKEILDAEVNLLSSQGEHLASLEHKGNGIFQVDNFSIETDKEYQLEVKSKDAHLSDVSSKSSVPAKPIAELLKVEEGSIQDNNAWIFEVEIDDNPTEENYYLLEGTFDVVGGLHIDGEREINGYIEPDFRHYSDDPNSENREIGSGLDFVTYALRSVYLTDKNFNGEKYKTNFGVANEFLPPSGVSANIYIKSVSKEMYEYHKTLDLHRVNVSDVFSDPQQVFSNIENGLGIFAGYSQKEIKIDLPDSEYDLPKNVMAADGCTAPCTVSFSTDGDGNLSYYWEFGDGATSTEPNPKHTYVTAGVYECYALVSTGRGDSASFDFVVVIN